MSQTERAYSVFYCHPQRGTEEASVSTARFLGLSPSVGAKQGNI